MEVTSTSNILNNTICREITSLLALLKDTKTEKNKEINENTQKVLSEYYRFLVYKETPKSNEQPTTEELLIHYGIITLAGLQTIGGKNTLNRIEKDRGVIGYGALVRILNEIKNTAGIRNQQAYLNTCIKNEYKKLGVNYD